MAALTKDEKQRYSDGKKFIKANLQKFYEVGDWLAEIRDGKLHREEYKTFEQFCKSECKIERRYAYYLIDSAKVYKNLCTTVHKIHTPEVILPSSEREIRPLVNLEPEQQQEAWSRAVEAAPRNEDGQPQMTAQIVETAVASVVGTNGVVHQDEPEPEAIDTPFLVETDKGKHVEIPTWLIPVFESRDKFQAILNSITQLGKKIDELASEEAGVLLHEYCRAMKQGESERWRHPKLTDVFREVKACTPHAPCPFCDTESAETVSQDCKACVGYGWVDKMHWEMAEPRKKEELYVAELSS